jgi:hypothetical protein
MSKLTTALKQYTVLASVYLLLAFFLPANKIAQHNYHLSSVAYHVLLFVVILPLVGIWFGAFYSYARLRQYCDAITDTAESQDFNKLTRGFIWLAWGSAITALVSIVLNAVANTHPGFLATSIIITNYSSLLVPLVAYSYISTGARSLNIRAMVSITGQGAKTLILFFMFIGVAYCYITFRYLDLHSVGSNSNPYYLPAWLMILTVIIPFLYTWFIGLLAAYEIYLYSKNVQGILYQRAMRLLSGGVISVIASSIAVQYLRSAVPRSGHLSLNSVLLIVNIAYIFMALGYVLISLGARQLRKIEEV